MLAGNADLGHLGLARNRFYPRDQSAQFALQIVERHQEIGAEGDEDIAVLVARDQRRAAEQTERLNDQREAEPLIASVAATERQQRAEPRLVRVPGRISVAVDRDALWQGLPEPLAQRELRRHEGRGAHIEHQWPLRSRHRERDNAPRLGAYRPR